MLLPIIFATFMFIIFLCYLRFPALVERNYKNYQVMTLRKDTYSTPPDPAPLVSVIIPARDEEKNMGKCLLSLTEQDYPQMEIIAVDDNSTDKTGEIIEGFQKKDRRVKLVKGKELPPGWRGKNFAIYQGIQQAGGEYLLFVDADVWLAPQCLSQTVCHAREHGSDLLILKGKGEWKGFWEKVIFPVYTQITWVLLPFPLLNDPRSRANLGGGPYLLFKREVYEEIGGHEKIKEEVTEDIVLVSTIKEQGLKLNNLFGRELLTIGAYTNLKVIWRQLSKSYFIGIGRKPWIVGSSLLMLFSFIILPWFSVLLSLTYLIIYRQGWFPLLIFLLGMGQCLSALFIRRRLKKYMGFDNTCIHNLLQPLGALMIACIMINSTVKTLSGKGVTWKGRTYH